MKTLIFLTTFVFFFQLIAFSQSELAIVSYNIGADVKEAQSENSHTLTKFETGDLFLCEPSNSFWWPVQRFNDRTGFVHIGSVKLVKDLPEDEQTDLVMNTLIKMQDYNSLPKEKLDSELVIEQFFVQNEYTYVLDLIPNLIKKTNDTLLLHTFLDILVNTEDTQNEVPMMTLGQIYINQADFVLNAIDVQNDKDKSILKKILQQGFETMTFAREEEIQAYSELKQKLETNSKLSFTALEN